MTQRLQVLLDEGKFDKIRRVARRHRMTVAEWVRQALRVARSGPEQSPQARAAGMVWIPLHHGPQLLLGRQSPVQGSPERLRQLLVIDAGCEVEEGSGRRGNGNPFDCGDVLREDVVLVDSNAERRWGVFGLVEPDHGSLRRVGFMDHGINTVSGRLVMGETDDGTGSG